jgi:hypothetical protein
MTTAAHDDGRTRYLAYDAWHTTYETWHTEYEPGARPGPDRDQTGVDLRNPGPGPVS